MAASTSKSPFTIIPQGALIQGFEVAGHNIVCSFPVANLYATHNAPYFGETIGRVANRISGARINELNGRAYDLAVNNGPNCLHGGKQGWGKKTFKGPEIVQHRGRDANLWTYLSLDGDEGFPGEVEVRVWYFEGTIYVKGVERRILEIEYEAELLSGAEETVVSITNHSYFNVGPGPTITGTVANLATAMHLPVDENTIPTGIFAPFPDLAPDKPIKFTDDFPIVDHCMVLNCVPFSIPLDTRASPLKRLVTLSHPETRITLNVESTEPAFQFYTGEYINVPAVSGQAALPPRAGIAIEPSRYVNAVNQKEWRGMVLLKKGMLYGSRIRYTAWQDE